MGYVTFIYFVTYLITFIDSVLMLYWITQVICIVKLLNVYQSYNAMNKYHWLIIHTHDYIYETESSLSLSFPVMHKILSSSNIFIKQDFILKNPGTGINGIFRN